MNGIIPKSVYRTIEYRLHTYNQMKERTQDWFASVYSTQNVQENIKGKGHVSDSTARIVINMLCPPKEIQEDLKWIAIIEEAKQFCEKKGRSKLFDVWYGCNPKNILSAARNIPTDKDTLNRWRKDTVTYIALRAVNNKLITL